eukprot:GHVR01009483.1.p2 GENE.GHVR01009483.1~~GHVR01009483.1.p2  ORF type:complete len:108 (+),score=13.58 GHVR01009483.1:431-754(+)
MVLHARFTPDTWFNECLDLLRTVHPHLPRYTPPPPPAPPSHTYISQTSPPSDPSTIYPLVVPESCDIHLGAFQHCTRLFLNHYLLSVNLGSPPPYLLLNIEYHTPHT